MTVTGDDALVGRVLDGRYLVGERIARGGMASVFKATDRRLDREVAIKVMHHGLGDDQQFTDRFVREARAAAKLNHRNVVSVFDQGRDGDVTYLVMEYVPGRTLRDIMRDEAPMKPLRTMQLLEQVLIALSAAHAARIIHRDVKPENVLITPDTEVKVADFGLARAVSAATTATGGTLIGTVSYLAPEIVLHEGADPRSDVYAVGAMMFEMLTGQKPHVGDSPIQVAYKHVHEDVSAPSLLRPDLPDYVDALVARATARDRDHRSTDARVLLQQVRTVRRALEQGVTHDAELVDDLLPRTGAELTDTGRHPIPPPPPAAADEGEDETLAVSLGALAAQEASSGRGAESTMAPGAESTMAPGVEPTMAWSTGPPAPPQGVDVVSTTAATGLHPPMSPEDYRAMRATHDTGRGRGRLLLIAALVAALIAAGTGWWYADGRYDNAPALVGTSEKDATAQAKRAGFTFKVGERRFSEDVPAGVVMSTNPEAGGKILDGATITAVVSKGKDRVLLPGKIKGESVDDFKKALAEVDLVAGQATEKYDETVKKGLVLGAVSIKADQQLKRGTEVDYYVSKGRQPIPVGDYTGKDATDAQRALAEDGFRVAVEEQFDDDVAKGKVITQNPKGGNAYKNDLITLTVSKGKDEVTVPNLVGKTREEAGKLLKKAGLRGLGQGNGNFRVLVQQPSAGDKVKRNSLVRVAGF